MISKTQECLEILKRGGVHTSTEIGEEIGIKPFLVCKMIGALRKSHLLNGKTPYIFTTKNGYSLESNSSGVIYEANMRMKMSVGVVLNGLPAFQKAKKIASTQLLGLRAQYKPDFIKIGSLI